MNRTLAALVVAGMCLALSSPSSATVILTPANQQITGNSTIQTLGTPFTGDDLWIGFTVDYPSGTLGSNEFYVLWFNSDPHQNIGIKGDQGPGSTDFLVRMSSGDGGAYSPTQLTIPFNGRLVGHLEKETPGAGNPYTKFSLWVNPTSETVPTPVATTGVTADTSVASLGKRAANNNDTVYFNDIVLATTFLEARGALPPPPQLLASADFNDLTTGNFNGQGGGSGWNGNWFGSANPKIIAGDLASSLYLITQSGTPLHVTGFASDPRHEYRTLNEALTGEIWFSCLLRDTDSADRIGLSFNPPTVTPFDNQGTAYFELRGSSLAYLFGPGTETLLPLGIATGQTHLVVGKMVVNGDGADDTIALWLDPDLTDYSILNDAMAFVQTDQNFAEVLSRVGVFAHSPGSDFDALYISNTDTAFFDVTGIPPGVPEPTTLALAALGLLTRRLSRRRRLAR